MVVQVDTAPVTEEVEVYRSSDGCSRASIVRRPDGFFCIATFRREPGALRLKTWGSSAAIALLYVFVAALNYFHRMVVE